MASRLEFAATMDEFWPNLLNSLPAPQKMFLHQLGMILYVP
jgi:hypothetical protein